MIPFSLFLAAKYLKPRRSFVSVVTVISVLGVLLGVAILVIVLSVMTGFDNMWREKILSFKPHLTVVNRYGYIENEEELCKRIDGLEGIVSCAAVVQVRALVKHGDRTAAPIVVGVEPERAKNVSRIIEHMADGSFELADNNTVLGCDLAAQIGVDVGDKVLVYSSACMPTEDEMALPEELVVSGLFDMGMRDYDADFMLTSLEAGRDLAGIEHGAHAIYVMTEDPFRFETYGALVQNVLGPAYAVLTWKDSDRMMFAALSHEKGLMGVLLGIITIVAIFCVTNTLIVITYQKTNEIGLLKALGVPSWKIMIAFVLHGWIQCVAGTLLGIGAGFLVLKNLVRISGWLSSLNVNAFPKEIYGLSEIPWAWSWTDVSLIALFVMVFCSLISLVPAGRAVWLDPVKAFRQE